MTAYKRPVFSNSFLPFLNPRKTVRLGIKIVKRRYLRPNGSPQHLQSHLQREKEEEERNELFVDGGIFGSASRPEGEGSDPLPASPQRHSQLGCPSPSLLSRCIRFCPFPFLCSDISSILNWFGLFCSNRPSFQASDLRERFDANKHVVRSMSVPLILFWSFFFFFLFFCVFSLIWKFLHCDLLWVNWPRDVDMNRWNNFLCG